MKLGKTELKDLLHSNRNIIGNVSEVHGLAGGIPDHIFGSIVAISGLAHASYVDDVHISVF
jgi:hypothetical protein